MSLKEKLQEEQNLSELLKETQELNKDMTAYIRIQMKEETVKDLTIESQLERIRTSSNDIIMNMQSILKKQEKLIEQSNEALRKVLTDGHNQIQENNKQTLEKMSQLESSSINQLKSMSEEISNSTNKMQSNLNQVVNEAKKESKDIVSHAKKEGNYYLLGRCF